MKAAHSTETIRPLVTMGRSRLALWRGQYAAGEKARRVGTSPDSGLALSTLRPAVMDLVPDAISTVTLTPQELDS